MKKLFGELNISWIKLIIFAVIAGIYTAVMAILPIAENTSFADISISFECWILFGIIIIINSKSPIDSALKCFIFFLISQPLVYLIQVPFSSLGWGIFAYYPNWFIWTLLTIPMGFIGYFLKKNKWWGLIILTPVIVFLGIHYKGFMVSAWTSFPRHLISALLCVVTMIIYPIFIFKDKRLKIAGLIISIVIILGMTVYGFASGKRVYSTTLLVNGGSEGVVFDDSYKVYLEDESYGTAYIVFEDNLQDYMVNADLIGTGTTKLIMEAPDGTKRVFELKIETDRYDIKEIK